MTAQCIPFDLAVTPVIFAPSRGTPSRLLLGPDSAKVPIERRIGQVFGLLDTRRSTLPIATHVSIVEGRALVLTIIDTRVEVEWETRSDWYLVLGLWIDLRVSLRTNEPISRGFEILESWIGEYVEKKELMQESASEFVRLCMEDNHETTVLTIERTHALLQTFEEQFGLARRALTGFNLREFECGRAVKRLKSSVCHWRTVERAAEFLVVADTWLGKVPPIDQTRVEAANWKGGDVLEWILLAILASLLAVGTALQHPTLISGRVLLRVLAAVLALVGEVLVIKLTDASTQAFEGRGVSAADGLGTPRPARAPRRALYVWMVGVSLGLSFLLIFISIVLQGAFS
jgi:hypothetical protein